MTETSSDFTDANLDPHIEQEPIMRFFRFNHLPEPLRSQSSLYCKLAVQITGSTPRSAERTVALRKLLESKDAAVRALLPADGKPIPK